MNNLHHITQRIRAAEKRYGRAPQCVTLLPVSKGHSCAHLIPLIEHGMYAFGENYVQEALVKISAFSDKPIEWHFIGTLQTNKAKVLAQKFSWVHTVTRLEEAALLSRHRPVGLAPLNICLQVHLDPQKSSGVAPSQVLALAKAVTSLPNVCLRGLMGTPPRVTDIEMQRHYFALLRHCFDECNLQGCGFDTLSMGMTDDIEAAIAEGSTLVRIGTGIFGQRE